MGQVSSKFRRYARGPNEADGWGLHWWCPACEEVHGIPVAGPEPRWGFDGDLERPTFTPSVKVTGKEPLTDEEYQRVRTGETIRKPDTVCHFFVTAGQIEFCGDCTHGLKGHRVPLPDLPEGLRDPPR